MLVPIWRLATVGVKGLKHTERGWSIAYLVANDIEYFIGSFFLFFSEYGQDAAEGPGRWSDDQLGGLLVEVWNVKRVLEHLTELTVVDAAVWTPVEPD